MESAILINETITNHLLNIMEILDGLSSDCHHGLSSDCGTV